MMNNKLLVGVVALVVLVLGFGVYAIVGGSNSSIDTEGTPTASRASTQAEREESEQLGVEHMVPKDDWTGEDMITLVRSILSDLELDEQVYKDPDKPRQQTS